MQKVKRLTCVPDFDRLVGGARDDCLPVGREGDGANAPAVCVLLLSLELESACGGCRKASGVGVSGMYRVCSPASQTLIVRSSEPETMVLPSGEKATD